MPWFVRVVVKCWNEGNQPMKSRAVNYPPSPKTCIDMDAKEARAPQPYGQDRRYLQTLVENNPF